MSLAIALPQDEGVAKPRFKLTRNGSLRLLAPGSNRLTAEQVHATAVASELARRLSVSPGLVKRATDVRSYGGCSPASALRPLLGLPWDPTASHSSRLIWISENLCCCFVQASLRHAIPSYAVYRYMNPRAVKKVIGTRTLVANARIRGFTAEAFAQAWDALLAGRS